MSTLNDSNLHSIAHRMLDDYDNATPGTVFSEGLLLDEADAWRLQQVASPRIMVPVPMLEFSALETGKDETKTIY